MRNQPARSNRNSDCCFHWTANSFFALVIALSLTSTTIAKDEIVALRKLTGKVADSALLSKRPSSGFVADQATWKSLWTSWRTGEEVLQVNFEKQIVLVATANGPNVVLTSSLNLTPSGDLRYEAASTKMAGPGFGYALLIVPRGRINSVNGEKLEANLGPIVAADPITNPTTLPPLTGPPQAKPSAKTKDGTASLIEESIRVEIAGRVRTGVMSRAESTGIMVVANGIVWELDLHNDPQLIDAAKQLGTDVGRIKGTLSKLDSLNRSFRWVVNVESIGPVVSPDVGNLKTAHASSPKPVVPRAAKTAAIPVPQPKAVAVPEQVATVPAAPLSGFRTIIISASGGRSNLERRQTVAADGSVTLAVPKTNYSESFSLDPAALIELHNFVSKTDWKTLPRSTGTVGKDAINFSITIDTGSGTKRFFIAGASIKSQPLITKLFSLMRKPK